MYTTGDGERRIRVINYRYLVTNKLEVLYEAGDYLAFANVLCREYVSKLPSQEPIKVRDEFIGRLVVIVGEFAQESQLKMRSSQFLGHPNLSPAFAYIHTILNSRLFLNHLKLSADSRMYEILKILSYGFSHFANRYYPKLISISMDIYEGEIMPGDYMETETE